jgi:S-adenosylmethionine hydrolase
MRGLVTLTTDFGTRDPYVGALKGTLLKTVADTHIVDVSHEIPPQDVLSGAYLLRHAAMEFPLDTVHLAVVDPSVGSRRRPLVVDAGGHRWVGPDNGLFSHALSLPYARAFEITHPDLQRQPMSATFHGRDLFAPTAARLAAGFPVEDVGPGVDDAYRLPSMCASVNSDRIEGAIIYVDHFGNAISCITSDDLLSLGSGELRVRCGSTQVCIVSTYADVSASQSAALLGSGDLLEVVVRDGSAAAKLGLKREDAIIVERHP